MIRESQVVINFLMLKNRESYLQVFDFYTRQKQFLATCVLPELEDVEMLKQKRCRNMAELNLKAKDPLPSA